MASKQTISQAKYDAKNTKRISLKLNIETDADILEAIDFKNIQCSVKKLIREGIKKGLGKS